nr:hypothetical protein Iba_chr01bCG4480 [Ipomoea batatas]
MGPISLRRAPELVKRALRMIVGTDLIKMIDPRAVLRYKMFSEAGLAANIAAALYFLREAPGTPPPALGVPTLSERTPWKCRELACGV